MYYGIGWKWFHMKYTISGSKLTHLVFFQGYLSLLFASNKCSGTSENLFIFLDSLNKISWKKANSIFNFSLWQGHNERRMMLILMTYSSRGWLIFWTQHTWFIYFFFASFLCLFVHMYVRTTHVQARKPGTWQGKSGKMQRVVFSFFLLSPLLPGTFI